MVLADDRILEYLRDSEHAKSATQLYESGDFNRSRPTISQRLQKLEDGSLVRGIGNGMYIITEQGAAYLDENYHVEKREFLDENQAHDGDSTRRRI